VQTTSWRSTFAPSLEERRWRARVPSRAAQTRHQGAPAARMPGGCGQRRPREHTVGVGSLRWPA
jgi:hypothetical protein